MFGHNDEINRVPNAIDQASVSQESYEALIINFLEKSELLIRVMNKETEYFRGHKMQQAQKILEHKASLVDELEQLKFDVLNRKVELEILPEALKGKVKESFSRLKIAAEDNYRESLKAKEVNRVIMEAVTGAMVGSKAENSSYSKYGEVETNTSSVGPMALIENV